MPIKCKILLGSVFMSCISGFYMSFIYVILSFKVDHTCKSSIFFRFLELMPLIFPFLFRFHVFSIGRRSLGFSVRIEVKKGSKTSVCWVTNNLVNDFFFLIVEPYAFLFYFLCFIPSLRVACSLKLWFT